ncbi:MULTISPECIES: hypothetical protein [unclassified Nocardia]|uniref:hypothetical protein n=1 Tax=Nocardia sp. NPDC060220 TaxID=3347076 RepID=UPI00364A9D38
MTIPDSGGDAVIDRLLLGDAIAQLLPVPNLCPQLRARSTFIHLERWSPTQWWVLEECPCARIRPCASTEATNSLADVRI